MKSWLTDLCPAVGQKDLIGSWDDLSISILVLVEVCPRVAVWDPVLVSIGLGDLVIVGSWVGWSCRGGEYSWGCHHGGGSENLGKHVEVLNGDAKVMTSVVVWQQFIGCFREVIFGRSAVRRVRQIWGKATSSGTNRSCHSHKTIA